MYWLSHKLLLFHSMETSLTTSAKQTNNPSKLQWLETNFFKSKNQETNQLNNKSEFSGIFHPLWLHL